MKFQWFMRYTITFLLIIKQLKPKVRFIISGDFKQLPPVCDRVAHIDYKESKKFI